MLRRLLNLLTLPFLLLFVAAAAMWVRSYRVDLPDRLALGESSFLVSFEGGIGWNYWSDGPPPSADDWRFLGFGCYRAGVGTRTLTEWHVPYWFLAAAAAFPPLIQARAWRRRRRRIQRHRCPACGYDLRATPGRCPECGSIAAAGG